MRDTEPQTAGGKVLWHFTMSLDGFVAGPNHGMGWMDLLTEASFRPGIVEEYVQTTGAILGGRNGWDAYPDPAVVYGGAWSGPIFVLTHHPEDATPADGVTFLTCDPTEAVRLALSAADGKNVHGVGEDDPTSVVNVRYRPADAIGVSSPQVRTRKTATAAP